MKVGLIVEGIPDAKVCEYFAKRIKPDIQIRTLPLGAKPRLLKKCGRAAKLLLEEGFDRVIIVWDLYPAEWEDPFNANRKSNVNAKPCCKQDRKTIKSSLQQASTDLKRIYLVCIETMLEIWLLIDIRAINSILSTQTRKSSIRKPPHLERNKDPKSLMINIFKKESKGGKSSYNDVDDAIRIARAIPKESNDLKRLKKLDSFVRFESGIKDC